MLLKNELYEVKIEDVNDLGYGVCRIDGQVVFVSRAVTGDSMRIRIIKSVRDYAVARPEALLCPSPHRVKASCPSFGRCGGCSYLHLTDAYEKELKEGFVKSALKKAGLELPVRPLISTPIEARLGYRNKAQFPLYRTPDGQVCIGFYARRSHTPVSADACVLQSPLFSEIAKAFCAAFTEARLSCYDETSQTGLLRHLNLRADTDGQVTAEIVVCAQNANKLLPIAAAMAAKFDCLKGVCANLHTENTNVIRSQKIEVLTGEMTLCQTLGDKRFFHGPASFFQVNTAAATLLFDEAKRLLNPQDDESVCDLYCGVGAVGQCIAPNSRLHGADVVKEAISFAEKNACENGCDASYVAMDAAEYFAAAGGFDTVLLDPPRSGLSERMVQLLMQKKPKKILYISCNPTTLCRDLAHLTALYQTDGITPVDLFPKTGHVECVVLLSRKDVHE